MRSDPRTNLIPLHQLLEEDLEAICRDLQGEFAEMSGHRLLITGGAGFLGYYLVQSALHWNRTRTSRPPIDIVVYDNYLRGVPSWLEMLAGESHLRLVTHDMTRPLPGDMGHF